jgi:hypothetical protein
MDNKITDNLTYSQVVFSNTAIRYGIDNTPTEDNLKYIKDLSTNIWESLYRHFKGDISVSSFYRCRKLNKLIGGSKYSQHMALKGSAIDIQSNSKNISNKDIFDYVLSNLEFDQLIWEFGDEVNPAWVHVSYNKDHNRNQVIYYK